MFHICGWEEDPGLWGMSLCRYSALEPSVHERCNMGWSEKERLQTEAQCHTVKQKHVLEIRQNKSRSRSSGIISFLRDFPSCQLTLALATRPGREMDSHRKKRKNLEPSMMSCRSGCLCICSTLCSPSCPGWGSFSLQAPRAMQTHLHNRVSGSRWDTVTIFNVSAFSGPAPSFPSQRGQGS